VNEVNGTELKPRPLRWSGVAESPAPRRSWKKLVAVLAWAAALGLHSESWDEDASCAAVSSRRRPSSRALCPARDEPLQRPVAPLAGVCRV